MVKKISFLVLSVAIVAVGIIAFKRLNYWERSIRIFRMGADQPFEGRMGRQGGIRPGFGEDRTGRFEGTGGFSRRGEFRERSDRPDFGALPDSVRARFEARRDRPMMRDRNILDSVRARFEEGRDRQMFRDRNIPDSLRQRSGRPDEERLQRGSFEGGIRNRDGHGRGDFQGGKKINLRNVLWFLAVFALFTVIVIYIDKSLYLIRKKKNGK